MHHIYLYALYDTLLSYACWMLDMSCVLHVYLSMSCVLAHIILLPRFTLISYEPLVSPIELDSHLWM